MKKITSGQVFNQVGGKHDPSRDYLFELTMASRFINGGYSVRLNRLADIEVTREGGDKIYVECKKIMSPKRIRDNVKKANEQLKTRFKSDGSIFCRGVVALNVSSVINPNNNTIVVRDRNELRLCHEKLLNDFCNEYELLLSAKKSKKCLGVIIEATLAGYQMNGNSQNIIMARGTRVLRYDHSEQDSKLINEIGTRLSNQKLMSS